MLAVAGVGFVCSVVILIRSRCDYCCLPLCLLLVVASCLTISYFERLLQQISMILNCCVDACRVGNWKGRGRWVPPPGFFFGGGGANLHSLLLLGEPIPP